MTNDDRIAIESIRKTIHSYTIAGDSRDRDLFATLWAEDAVMEFAGFGPVPGFRSVGRAEIVGRTQSWSPVPGQDPSLTLTRFIRHNLTTSLIDLTGADTAKSRTYFVVLTEIGQDHAGTYNDEFILEGGNWLFSHRRIEVDWRSDGSLFPPLK